MEPGNNSSFEDLGWEVLVSHLADRAHTSRGAAAVRGMELFERVQEARHRIEMTCEARKLRDAAKPMGFGGIVDIVVAVGRAEKGAVLPPEDLIAVGDTGRGCDRLRKQLQSGSIPTPLLADLALGIGDLGHVFHPILESFDNDGTLADHASEALGGLRRKVNSLRAELDRRAGELLDNKRIQPYLQDQFYTQRDDRYVLPIKVEARSRVKGIVHGTSQSGQTVFIEPEQMVDLNNRLKLAECEVADEERRILKQLSGYVSEEAEGLRMALFTATKLDVIDACARLAEDLSACAPIIEAGGGVELSDMRHPLMVLSERPCVPNDIVIQPHSVLVVSGPNAGGKTVALKAVGLAALMVRAGLHVSARAGRMAWFTRVHTDIGDSQSIEMDLSTFSARLLHLRSFLTEADGSSLLLVDEIAVGTEPEQGAALAEATLEALADLGVTGMTTTHYEGLKALAARDDRFANASVGFDFELMEPTFRLHLGAPGSSGALHVARRMGLPEMVLDRASEILGERRAGVEELLTTLQEKQQRLDEERAEVADTLKAAEAARQQAEAARAAAKEMEKRVHRDAHNQAIDTLRSTRHELEQIKDSVRRRRKAPELAAVKREIDRLSSSIAGAAPERELPEGRKPGVHELIVGLEVYVIPLGGRGRIAESPSRGKVVVQVGGLRTKAKVGDLLIVPVKQKSNPSSSSARGLKPTHQVSSTPAAELAVRTPDSTCDLRGERVEEAVSALDRFIDASLMAAREVIFVIHGHGTGALRAAVRAHADSHACVSKWRPGEQNEGGDGVTVIAIDAS